MRELQTERRHRHRVVVLRPELDRVWDRLPFLALAPSTLVSPAMLAAFLHVTLVAAYDLGVLLTSSCHVFLLKMEKAQAFSA